LKDYSHYSNNLYNYSLYVANQFYKETGKYIGYGQLEKEVKSNENYSGILLNADINGSGNILRKVIGDTWLCQPIVDLMLNPVKINFYKETLVS
jgi:hypothetical protein